MVQHEPPTPTDEVRPWRLALVVHRVPHPAAVTPPAGCDQIVEGWSLDEIVRRAPSSDDVGTAS